MCCVNKKIGYVENMGQSYIIHKITVPLFAMSLHRNWALTIVLNYIYLMDPCHNHAKVCSVGRSQCEPFQWQSVLFCHSVQYIRSEMPIYWMLLLKSKLDPSLINIWFISTCIMPIWCHISLSNSFSYLSSSHLWGFFLLNVCGNLPVML